MPLTAPSTRAVLKRPLAFTDDDEEDAPPGPRLPEPKLRNPPLASKPATTADDDGDDDDYMSMTVADTTTSESALQRLKRRKQEASVRGHPLSKAELAHRERQKRDIGLSTSILSNTASKGLKMMKAMGYSTGSALGKAPPAAAAADTTTESRTIEPIRPVMRESRTGVGHASELKRKFGDDTATGDNLAAMAKRQELSPESYRNRLTMEAQQRRQEAQLFAAQSTCEKLVAEDPPVGHDAERENKDAPGPDDGQEKTGGSNEAGSASTAPNRPVNSGGFLSASPTFAQIKQVNLIYRGLLYRRALADLKVRLKKQQLESLSSKSIHIPTPNLPTYNSAGEFSEDDKLALSGVIEEGGLLDEEIEDPELEEFEKRDVKDRLDEIVRYLRSQWRYCFWCKFRYGSDEELEKDCPGPEEEDHD
ncbi:hypothetical protein DRE_02630 [Drechslerella stenobrocha 248]|uniref:G-patch domain-containing protein n=1 Tax=Drechslerella stenobrocha 248 TaxID=1043628 RepID=W7HV48_9PEZI|nr:hypothetical protein DRE_02630 [Drechslerella stenobrocha 248]